MTETNRMRVEDLDTPVLLLDREAMERNIARMRDLTARAGIKYRPHSKSHKSPVIAEMQLAAGAGGICCAKLGEAEVMAAAGIPDILITTEVVGRSKLTRLLTIAQQSRVAVVADDERNVAELAAAAQTAGVRLDVLVEVDVGQGRCGVPPGSEAARLAQVIAGSRWLRFRGLQGYQGAIQMTGGFAARETQVKESLGRLMETAELVRKAGMEVETLTGGGTGTSIIDGALHGLTELQPGSYVFMDSKYRAIEWPGGAMQPFETSLTILGTVISRPAPDRAIVDVGLKAASSDHGPVAPVNLAGATYAFAGDEHGHLRFEGGRCPLSVGDKVTLVPSHCDTTVNLYDRYVVTKGGSVDDVWDIAARGRVQ
jgi:D-serine deaminase-like pyridoxal phosphate-dependent protein